MTVKFTNNASATLATSINTSVTTIQVTAGQGAQFPTLAAGDYFYVTLVDSSNNLEVMKVTARTSDAMTVVRAQDSTTARAFLAGDKVELRPVAAALNAIGTDSRNYTDTVGSNLTAHLADTSDAHDASAISVVPTGAIASTDVQAALAELDTEKVPTTRAINTSSALTGGGNLSADRTLDIAATGVTAASYGSATKIPVIAVNAKGQITSASEATIVPFAWNTTYVSVGLNPGDTYTLPANCIGIYVWSTVYGGGNNGGIGRALIKDSGGSVIGTMHINGANIGSGADGGSGMLDGAGSFIPTSSAATAVTFDIVSNAVSGGFTVQAYVTKA